MLKIEYPGSYPIDTELYNPQDGDGGLSDTELYNPQDGDGGLSEEVRCPVVGFCERAASFIDTFSDEN